jgi:hypothetical protein
VKAPVSISVIGTALAVAGCTTPMTKVPEACAAQPAQVLVGQQASASTGSRAVTLTGARTLRWGPPNSAWTMDYRQDRVNVRYDEAMKITEVTCG